MNHALTIGREKQSALQDAYESGKLRGSQLIQARRVIERRRTLGRSLARGASSRKNAPSTDVTPSSLVRSYLRERGQATRSQINTECFRGKVSKSRIDACLEHLLAATPPRITVQWSERADGAPGAPLRVYRLTAA